MLCSVSPPFPSPLPPGDQVGQSNEEGGGPPHSFHGAGETGPAGPAQGAGQQ